MNNHELIERIGQMKEALANGESLRAELLERATYLHSMDESTHSTIAKQSIATMYRAADALRTLSSSPEKMK